ncbi:MAG TPA: PLP-dependent aminotransferase family protein [Longimicrobiaceae bacterium]|nr:PLP-dependent aminotransferase family protein [Longimicrobiaceae bacterium]
MSPWTPKLADRHGPVYLAIVDAIAADVREGRLHPGTRLPPQRELAERLGVNLSTVTRAYTEAKRRGLLAGRVGQGTYVKASHPAGGWGAEVAEGVIDLSFSVPPEPEDVAIEASLAAVLEEIQQDRAELRRALHYTPPGGAARDREAGGRFLRARSLDAPMERLLVCAGAQHALAITLPALAGPGEVVLTEQLTYPGVRSLAAMLRIRLEGVAIDREGILPDAFREACRRHRPRALFCVPTIQNPTAVVMPTSRREEVAGIAREHGVTIVEDDVYGLLPPDVPPPIAALAPDITVYVSGLSKQLSPGLRIGYLLAPDEARTQRIAAHLRATIWMAPPLTAAVATRWVSDGTADRVLGAIRRELWARQALATRILGHAALSTHPYSPHLWMELPPAWPRSEFVARVRERGVNIVASDSFAVGEPVPNAVRISLGGPPDRASLAPGLEVVADLLDHPVALTFPLA